MKIYDISVTIQPKLVTWADSEVCIEREWVCRIENGEAANVSCIKIGSHLGTHLDAPLHFVAGGATVDQLSLDDLIGPCMVIDLPDLPQANVTAADLDAAAIPENIKRVLFKTSNTRKRLLEDPKFHTEFVAVAPDAAQWLVDRGIRAVGIDYLSVGSAADDSGPETHVIMLSAGLVLLEGLSLKDVPPGHYMLVALPLKVEGAEGCPMRAVLIEDWQNAN